jgi:hypothetical protein
MNELDGRLGDLDSEFGTAIARRHSSRDCGKYSSLLLAGLEALIADAPAAEPDPDVLY